MSRPPKDHLDYFSVDVDFDKKIEAIELMHKNDGLVWVLKFWQTAYKTMTGLVDFNGLFGELFANKCRITHEEHEKILKTAITVEFCYEYEPGVYTSHGIQKRISAVSSERAGAIQRQNKEKEKKGKKSKVKDCPDYSANNDQIIIPDHLKEIWPKYVEMRNKIKKPMTDEAVRLAIKKLDNLSKDCSVQVKIIEKSIFNSWQGLFALDEEKSSSCRKIKLSGQYPEPDRPLPILDLSGGANE